MKSRVLFLLALWVSSMSVSAQNLVPNGSFEEGSECPMFLDDLHFRCNDWYKSIQVPGVPMNENPSPDWYHACSENDLVSTPSYALGYQEPFDGDGYAAFASYDAASTTYREILGVELTEPLSIGTTYIIKFRIVGETEQLPTGIASNNIGFKFSLNPIYFDSEDAINNTAHGFNSNIISDTLNWTELSFEYTSTEEFGYLHIGNFFDDANTDIIDISNVNANNAYYLIDDVSVTFSTLSDVVKSEESKVVLYPNPASSYLHLSFNDEFTRLKTFKISDAIGR